MSIVNFNRPFFPSWNNFFDDILPETKFINGEWINRSVPAANIEEKENSFVIKMAVPGVEKEDINIEIKDNQIIVSAGNETSEEEEKKNYSRKEYSYKSFKRSFTLPKNVNDDQVEANYKNGELVVELPNSNEVPKEDSKIVNVA